LLIIFDLDGTLIDSSKDLTISTNATRAHFDLPPLDEKVVSSYVGNGAPVLIRRAMGTGASEETVASALAFFLKYYRAHALENTKLYTGVRGMIEDLARDGHRLGVLTNKPRKISFDILAALRIERLFLHVYGGDTLPNKKPNPAGILLMAKETAVPVSDTLMVGDSKVDVQTARNAGARSCGVTWGFQPETFDEFPPDFIVERPVDLINTVRAWAGRHGEQPA
jgi:phosphoglycolate phosphatase